MVRKVESKSAEALTAEWDNLASVRFRQLINGEDLTFKYVIAPKMLALSSRTHAKTVIDAGCGVGVLSGFLAEKFDRVTGVDPSQQSIALAEGHCGDRVEFFRGTLEEYVERNDQSADLVVANMVMMDVLDLPSFLTAANRVTRPGGALVFSITHPWFWPIYYGYAKKPWFRYCSETIVESAFRISTDPDCGIPSTHIHRPLETYVRTLLDVGFHIEALIEPMPTQEVNARYPKPWEFPRYLVGLCRR
jgi:2-polyprenyl-3-methyl-5-hydroxy-6-metoxy-1,4-benzoquinol methylase